MLLRHLLAILILPFLVVGIVPWALRRGSTYKAHVPRSIPRRHPWVGSRL
jgi:hypothetical protein